MADKQLNALTAASALSTADLFYIEQGSNSRKATGAQIQALVAAGVGLGKARVGRSGNLTAQNFNASSGSIAWNVETLDVGGWWDSGNPSYFTVPSGVNYVEFGASIRLNNINGDAVVFFDKDTGSGFAEATEAGHNWASRSTAGQLGLCVSSGPYAVSAGHKIRLMIFSTDNSIDVTAANSSFWIKALQG